MKLIKHKSWESIMFGLFLLSVVIFKLPNFYLIPGLSSPFLTIQAIGRVLIAVVFAYNILHAFIKGQKLFSSKSSLTITIFILLLFLVQSISVVNAQNISAFVSRYKDVFIGYIAFFNFYFYRHQYKKITLAFIITLPINIIYQLAMVANPLLFEKVFRYLIYNRHFEVVEINLARGRTYVETFDEISIPFLFIFLKNSFYLLGVSAVLTSFVSLVSNWRTRVAMLLFSFAGSLFYIFKKHTWNTVFLFIGVIIISSITDTFLLSSYGYSFYDRIIATDTADRKTITSRVDQIENSIEMAQQQLWGVGLGNYYDNLPISQRENSRTNTLSTRQKEIASEYVHNYFGLLLAESGIMSMILFLVIFGLFIRQDISYLRSKNEYLKAYVIAFWTLFIYASLNPLVPGTSQILFWGIRGILLIEQDKA